MTSEAELAEIIDAGFGQASFKLYVAGLTAVLLYDYLLTLEDEIRYAWKAENFLVLAMFLLARYLPIVYQVWFMFFTFYPGYPVETCTKTIFITSLYSDSAIAISQIVLALRAYAITMKNKWVAGILYTFSGVEFVIGMYKTIRAAVIPLPATSTIPLVLFRYCDINVQRPFITVQLILPLMFEITVFVLVVVQVRLIKSRYQGVNTPKIIDRIGRDAEVYFMVITVYNLLGVVMYFGVKPPINGIPIVGNSLLMPMFISRMIISLRKAAASQRSHTTVDVPAGTQTGNLQGIRSLHPSNDIQLSTLKS